MSINKDQVDGRMKEAGGKVQEVAGRVMGNNAQELKGAVKKTAGAAQAKFGDLKQDVQDAAKKNRDPKV